MRHRSWILVVSVVALWGGVPAAAQSGGGQPARSAADLELERRFRAEVAQASPAAAEAFDQGNTAREAGRFEEALAAYRRAIELAPSVDHPHRRACGTLRLLNREAEAFAECEAALKLAPGSPYNQKALAVSLARRAGPGDLDRAAELAGKAVEQQPTDAESLTTWCSTLLDGGRFTEFEQCATRLLAADPKGVAANYFGALVAGNQGEYALARRRIEDAKAAGLPDEQYRNVMGSIDRAEAKQEDAEGSGGVPAPSASFLWAILWILLGWLAAMGVLLVAGYVLSHLTLRAVGRVTSADASEGAGTPHERRLRKLYKAVLLLCGVYFYLSIPILLALIVVAGGGIVYFFFAVGYIPVKLVAIVGIVVLFTVGAILRSLFVRSQPGPLGHQVELEGQPRLRALLEDVAATVGTRPVDAVYLTPGTDMAVTERAGLWSSLRGKRAERSLIMGVGLFDGMTQLQLRSVLAHEHGHFRNEDTAGGGFALAVRSSLFRMIIRLAQSGVAGAFNPVWWFLRAYHRVYLGVSQGASRLQEVLADRWAIRAYGTAGFVGGYRHVVARSVAFDHQVSATLKEVVDHGRALPNLYQYRPESGGISDEDLASAIETEMTREPSPYDSHPSPRQRLEWATALAVEHAPRPGDDEPIWALFDGREALERAMTAEVRESIYANHGIQIDAVARADADAAEAEGGSDGDGEGDDDSKEDGDTREGKAKAEAGEAEESGKDEVKAAAHA